MDEGGGGGGGGLKRSKLCLTTVFGFEDIFIPRPLEFLTVLG